VYPLELSQQTLLIAHETSDRQKEADSTLNIGLGWLELGELGQARSHLEDGLRLMRAVGDRGGEPYALNGLSEVARLQDDGALAMVHAQSALDIAISVHDPFIELLALQALGRADLALGHHAEAKSAFERAHVVALLVDPVARHNAAVGLSQVALARGDVAGALRTVREVLALLTSSGTPEGYSVERHFIHWSCYQVLECAGDPRAAEILTIAHVELERRAVAIIDETLRHSFLHNIPEHRAIAAAWHAHRAASAGAH
jgi:tetratricopeptide (TPR) repeat protein